jgi:small subunit ribosomal protein S16
VPLACRLLHPGGVAESGSGIENRPNALFVGGRFERIRGASSPLHEEKRGKPMAVKIRLARMGAKKKPFYRLVAADTESPRDGRFLEILGHYDPMKDPAEVTIHEDKVHHWLEKGAMISEAAKSLLKKEGFLKAQSTGD